MASVDILKFPPTFRGGCITRYEKQFKRFCTLNSWSDKRAYDVLVTLLPDHLADLLEGWCKDVKEEDIQVDDLLKKLANELNDPSDILTQIDNITLIDDQVDAYVSNLKQVCGSNATEALLTSALLRQLSAEMRQSAILHTDGSLAKVMNHVKAYFRSQKSNTSVLGAISSVPTHTVKDTQTEVLNQVLETQRQQQVLLQQQTELLKSLSLSSGQNVQRISRRTIQCYYCNQFGHIQRNCPQNFPEALRGATQSRFQAPRLRRQGNGQEAWVGRAQASESQDQPTRPNFH